MIDIENKIVDTVARAVIAEFPTASVYSEYVSAPESFPCVTITEDDNYTYRNSQTADTGENHANIVYSVNIYSNLSSGNKEQAKAILNIVDTSMQNMYFTRTMVSRIPNQDRTIYRITARYIAVIEKGKTQGQNTDYDTYRR